MGWIFGKIQELGELIILALIAIEFIKAIYIPNALDIIILVGLLLVLATFFVKPPLR